MACRFYREEEVAQLLDMATAIDVVDQAYLQLAIGGAENAPRRRTRAPGFVLHGMHATADYLKMAGWKHYSTTREGARFHVGLYDCETGEMRALLEADALGQLRTAAATGVAARYLANKPIHQIGLFGTGWQAEGQLEALASELPLKTAIVYSRNEGKRQDFATKMQDQLGIDVLPVHDPREAVEDLPLVVTATTSRDPVFDGNLLAEGALICGVGSNWLHKAELDVVTIRRADNLVCDSIEACQLEAGDFAFAQEQGYFDWQRVVSLGSVIAGECVGRNNPDSVVVFKTVGLAILDVALGAKFLERASGRDDLGVDLPF